MEMETLSSVFLIYRISISFIYRLHNRRWCLNPLTVFIYYIAFIWHNIKSQIIKENMKITQKEKDKMWWKIATNFGKYNP